MLQQMAYNYNSAWKLNETEGKGRIVIESPGGVSVTEMYVNYALQIYSLHFP
jgi:hypothetical protein